MMELLFGNGEYLTGIAPLALAAIMAGANLVAGAIPQIGKKKRIKNSQLDFDPEGPIDLGDLQAALNRRSTPQQGALDNSPFKAQLDAQQPGFGDAGFASGADMQSLNEAARYALKRPAPNPFGHDVKLAAQAAAKKRKKGGK